MPVDELPIYPTPKQASYAAHNGNHHSSSSGRKLKSSSHQKSYKPSKSSHYQHLQPQHTASHHSSHSQHPSGHYQAPPPSQQSYYQPQAYQPPPPQPQPQSHPPQVTGHAAQMGRPAYNQPQVAPTPQQYYHQSPPAPTAAPVPVPAPTPPQQLMYHQPSSHHQQYAPPPPSTSHHQLPQAQSPRKVYQTIEATSGHNRPSPSHDYSHQSLPQVPMKKPPPSNSIGQMQPHMRSKESLHEKPLSSKQKLEIELRSVFDKVDINNSGRISKDELSNALLNFDHTRFQDSTIRLMINLFSNAHNGSSKHLNFDQFVSLWKYLSAYKKLFIQADTNNSGDISFGEFQKILEQIGYKLNIDLVLHLFQRFSYKDYETNDSAAIGKLKFDRFIELLVYLRKLTDVFKKYDKDLSGVATINFLDFLFEVSNLS